MRTTVTRTRQPLAAGCPPAWASAWGEDRYGPWAEFELPTGEATQMSQRLRWVPPGEFLMGLPESDKWTFENERPQHLVRIREGYWLFDTPCTQELWSLVMGSDHLCRFTGPRRPVEHVSWDDCQRFLVKLNDRLAGLGLTLPTEAQWEYACRAGTTDARYGDLDEVAWHAENSGGETHPVGLKVPNAWGLSDMLGNVDEWCIDGMRNYTKDRQFDPVGPTYAGTARVIRGGSWADTAPGIHATCRIDFQPGHISSDLGFRCLSFGGRAVP